MTFTRGRRKVEDAEEWAGRGTEERELIMSARAILGVVQQLAQALRIDLDVILAWTAKGKAMRHRAGGLPTTWTCTAKWFEKPHDETAHTEANTEGNEHGDNVGALHTRPLVREAKAISGMNRPLVAAVTRAAGSTRQEEWAPFALWRVCMCRENPRSGRLQRSQ